MANVQGTTGVKQGIIAGLKQPTNISGMKFASFANFQQAIKNSNRTGPAGRPIVDLTPGSSFKIRLNDRELGVAHQLTGFNKNGPFAVKVVKQGKDEYLQVTAKKNQSLYKKDMVEIDSQVVASGAKTTKYKFYLEDGLHVLMG